MEFTVGIKSPEGEPGLLGLVHKGGPHCRRTEELLKAGVSLEEMNPSPVVPDGLVSPVALERSISGGRWISSILKVRRL